MFDGVAECTGCGLPIHGEHLVVGGRIYHQPCALEEPESEEELEESKYRDLLKRLAHWGNSLGWGQST